MSSKGKNAKKEINVCAEKKEHDGEEKSTRMRVGLEVTGDRSVEPPNGRQGKLKLYNRNSRRSRCAYSRGGLQVKIPRYFRQPFSHG